MRMKYRIQEKLKFLAFAFYPKTTLIACTVLSAIIIAVLGIVMATVPHESNWYNIVFALTTGVVGSFIVSVVVELTGNYKHNRLAWYELQDYYSAVLNYESYKQIMMRQTPHQRAEQKAYEEYIAAGGMEELDEDDKPKDIIQIMWEQLPEIIPVFSQTLNDKKEFLSDAEIEELKIILSDYHGIQLVIRERILMSPMTYDALNHPDEDNLKSIYPSDVIKNMPDWIRRYLSSKESQKACKIYEEAILSDPFLLSQFMKDYDISQSGLENYQNDLDKLEEEELRKLEEIDYDELDFSQPEDEEISRAQNEKFDIQMELEQRRWGSGHLSRCCKNISESIEVLEKSIRKKPYYGMMIKLYNNSAREPIDDIMSTMSYESEKKRLDKKLAKQKAFENRK